MKKLACLFTLMFAMVLMNTSCEKPNDTPDNTGGLITQTELNGTWNFQIFKSAGITDITPATTCQQVTNLTSEKRWVKLGLTFHKYGGLDACDFIDACDVSTNDDNVFVTSFVSNKITLDNNVVFLVTKYTSATKTLELKMIDNGGSNYVLKDAVYTLVKQ